MMIFLTAILIIVAFVIGVLVGRILKMSFGCSGQDDQSQATVETKPAVSTAVSASSESTSASPSANFVSSGSGAAAEDKPSPTTKVESAPSKPKTVSGTVKKTSASKTAAKDTKTSSTKTTTAKKPASAPKAKSKAISASKTATVKSVTATNTAADDLKLIKGVGKLNETRLNDEGVTTFAQIAAWKKTDIADFDDKLNFKGRIARDEWVPQAKALAKAKNAPTKSVVTKNAPAKKTAEVTPAAIKKASVKATAPKAPKKKATPKAAVKKPSVPDDLKLIKGVGKMIETKLAKEGITAYSQIAAWKKADIIEFDEKLSFKGRIDRDDWINQAKVLAKGGTTEFSKRAAKGKVPSSS